MISNLKSTWTFLYLTPSVNITKLEQLQKICHLYSFWNVELSTNASADISADCRLAYRWLYRSSAGLSRLERESAASLSVDSQTMVGRLTSPTDHRHLVDLTPADTSVDCRSTWRSIYRPTLDQHLADIAYDMSTDSRLRYRPIHRSTYVPQGLICDFSQSMSSCSC